MAYYVYFEVWSMVCSYNIQPMAVSYILNVYYILFHEVDGHLIKNIIWYQILVSISRNDIHLMIFLIVLLSKKKGFSLEKL